MIPSASAAPQVTLVNSGRGGLLELQGPSTAISADGRLVAFASDATTLGGQLSRPGRRR